MIQTRYMKPHRQNPVVMPEVLSLFRAEDKDRAEQMTSFLYLTAMV